MTVLRPGAVIANQYRLIEEIGRGASGVVFRAEQLVLERPVAIKLLRTDATTDARAQAQFLQEAKVAARLSHPNIAAIFDFGHSRTTLYLVMEYVPGPTLRQWLSTHRTLPISEILRFSAQLLGALSEAHNVGISHGDVKSDNVLVQHGRAGLPWIKLVDFGVARFGQAVGRRSHGTRGYAAPELRNGATASVATDIYAAGAVLFEMITGAPPMTGSAEIDAVLSRADLTPELRLVCQTALAETPSARFVSAAEMRAALTGEITAETMPTPRLDDLSATATDTALFPLPWLGERADLDVVIEHLTRPIGPALVVGSIGSGRSRLLTEAAAHVSSGGSTVLHLSPDPTGQRTTLYPIRALVAALIGTGEGPRDIDAIARILSGSNLSDVVGTIDSETRVLPFLLGLNDPYTELEPEVRRHEMVDFLAQLILHGTTARPLALVFDDVDQYDSLSVEIIQRIAQEVPMALSCEPANVEQLWPTCLRVYVPALSAAHIEKARNLLHGRVVLPATTEILATSGGNAAWLEQAVLHLDRGGAPTDLGADLPTLIGLRFASMPASVRQLCEAASVFGQEVDLSILRAAVATLDALDLCEAFGWLCRDGHVVRFAHPLLRDVVYARLSTEARLLHHERAASETFVVTSDSAVLGYHWERAGMWEEAADALALTAEHAAMMGDTEGAVAWYERTIACLRVLLDSGTDVRPQLVTMTIHLATATRRAGAPDVAMARLRECRIWSQSRAEHADLDRASALALSDLGQAAEALHMLRRGIGIASAGGELILTVDLTLDLAQVLVRCSDVPTAIAELTTCIEQVTNGEGVRSLNAPPNLWMILRKRAQLRAYARDLPGAITDARSAQLLAATVSSAQGRARSLSLLADLLEEVGDVNAATTREAARVALARLGQRAGSNSDTASTS